MIDKFLIIFCYFNYHPKTRLIDVKIGFGPPGKIEKVECRICKKVYIPTNEKVNTKIFFIIILLILFLLLLF